MVGLTATPCELIASTASAWSLGGDFDGDLVPLRLRDAVSPLIANDLLEREFEVTETAAGIEEARLGRGQLLVVQAAAGLGKTSLLAAARRTARENGMRVLTARGSELESSFPFGVVRQLFESVLHGASDELRARWLSGAAELAATWPRSSRS